MKRIVILCALVALTGCSKPSETSVEEVREVAESLVYVKARNGLCFGVTNMVRLSSSGSVTENVLLVNVPCEGVGK